MDAGIIAIMKGMLRTMYSKWAIHLVQSFMATGGDPAEFTLPLGKQSATANLLSWLCDVFKVMNTEKNEMVVHCWEKTGLLGAWLNSNQILAVMRAAELFPNMGASCRGIDDAPSADVEEDTDVGAPIDKPADVPVLLPNGNVHRAAAQDDELLMAASWIDWDAAAGAGRE